MELIQWNTLQDCANAFITFLAMGFSLIDDFSKAFSYFGWWSFNNVPKPNARMDLTSSPQRKLFLNNEFCENVMKLKRSLPGRFFTFVNTYKSTIYHMLKHWVFFVKKKIIFLFVFQALTQKVVKMYENDVRSWLSKREKKNQRKNENCCSLSHLK